MAHKALRIDEELMFHPPSSRLAEPDLKGVRQPISHSDWGLPAGIKIAAPVATRSSIELLD
jgi:hypothetical protein